MPPDFKCAVRDCDTTSRSPNRSCHAHQRSLKLFGDPVGTRRLFRDQHGTVTSDEDGGCRSDLCREAETDRRRGISAAYTRRGDDTNRPRQLDRREAGVISGPSRGC